MGVGASVFSSFGGCGQYACFCLFVAVWSCSGVDNVVFSQCVVRSFPKAQESMVTFFVCKVLSHVVSGC